MKALLAFGLIVLLAYLGSRFLFRWKKRFLPLGYLFLSGVIYIFLGYFLGKNGLNVLGSRVLEGLKPLISLGLGWVGFLFGFQLEYRNLKKFPRNYIRLSFFQALSVTAAGTAVLIFLLRALFPSQPDLMLYGMGVMFGILLSLNSPSLLNYASSFVAQKGSYYYLARFLVSVSGFWGVTGLALVASFWHFPFSEKMVSMKGAVFLLASTILAVLTGYLFHLLSRKKTSEEDLLVYLLGLVFFTSGAATYFNLPPLYLCMVLGITYSNLSRIQEKLYPLLLSTEKPFYIIFLILIGASWEFDISFSVVLVVLLLLGLRIAGYSLFLLPFGRLFNFSFPLHPLFGLCFISSGGIAVAFVFSLKLMYDLPLTDVFVSAALMVIVISEFFSPLALKYALEKLEKVE
ncbi:MAG: hypothetical protein ACE5LC_09560 [Candidatus Aminicenantales bacterium]